MRRAVTVLCIALTIALAVVGLRMWQAEEQRDPAVNGSPVAKNIRVGGQYAFHDRLNYIADYKIHSGWTVTVMSVRLAGSSDIPGLALLVRSSPIPYLMAMGRRHRAP